MHQTKNLAIVGGGTAGLTTALILRARYPQLPITLIESDRIGIIGVGEGSTEHWAAFMSVCDITLEDLFRHTGATFKYGINFQDWTHPGSQYVHSVSEAYSVPLPTGHKWAYPWMIAQGCESHELVHDWILPSLHRPPHDTVNQFHFDTHRLNEYLHDLCQQRGIDLVRADISDVVTDSQRGIRSLITEEGDHITHDFYIDCTGFARLLTHRALGAEWISYREYLPMNSALAFQTPAQDLIPSWTLSRAMNAGWMWRIPTQDRWGNGYVFDDRFATWESAQAEVERVLAHPIEPARKIQFQAGRLNKAWIKNCVSIGISSSFVEPLEASTIGAGLQQALEFASRFGHYAQGDHTQPQQYNTWNTELIDNILSFIALHYRTERTDTPFWQSVQTLPTTEHFRAYYQSFQQRVPDAAAFPDRSMMFKEANWLLVMQGLNQLPPEAVQRDLDMTPQWSQDMIREWIHRVEQVVKDVWPTLETHRSAIETVKSR